MASAADFAFEHLPPELQEVSKPFHDLAVRLEESVPPNTEQHKISLQKLLESKDAAVRAAIRR